MEIEVVDNTIILSGLLDETVTKEALSKAFSHAQRSNTDQTIRINFKKIDRANSIGLRTWIQALLDSRPTGFYEEVPEWLLDQFVYIPNLLNENLLVESIMLPFHCIADGEQIVEKCTLGKEIPILPSYESFRMDIKRDGKIYELDFSPDVFLFITEANEAYKKTFDKNSA